MDKYTVLPFLNSAFEPGGAEAVVEGFEDPDLRNIARAELFYFKGQPAECCSIVEGYLDHSAVELRLSACMLYGYANMTMRNSEAARRGLDGIWEYLRRLSVMNVSDEVRASIFFASYVGSVLLHHPIEGVPPMEEFIGKLPEGLRLFAVYLSMHKMYLSDENWSAYGMGKAALFMSEATYPVAMIYIRCMMAVCMVRRRYKKNAKEELMCAWRMATKDGLLEPFIEHHSLLRGLLEVCVRKDFPEAYQQILDGVMRFSRGWMALHNPGKRNKVTSELSPMEFSIAMLASEGWTNKEIASYMELSVNTIKHYLTDIFGKLDVKKRDELKAFMLD